MKKATVFALAAALTIGLCGCGNSNTTETEAETVTEAVTEAPETEAETAEETEKVTEAVTEVETETESETEEVTEAETETESETEEVTEAETESETEEVTEAETESETEEVTEAETESETEEVTEAETESETEEVSEAVTEVETEAETESETEEVTEAETETETEEVTEAETETETEEVTEAVTEAETEEVTEAVTEAESEEATEAEAEVMTYEEYIAADVDTLVVVEAYVQAKQSWWDDTATVYTQDEDGAYFLYNMACSEEDYELLEVGTKIQVTGYKSEWSGEVEIIDATFEIIDDGDTFVAEALDVTELLGTDELEEHQNEYVSFTGMTVEASEDADGNEAAFLYAWDGSGSEGDDLYFNVSYNGETYNFVIESYLCDSTTEVYQAVTELTVGDVIDMEGFLYWYEGVNPHITSVEVTEAAAAEEETEAETETEEVTEAVTEAETEEVTEAETEEPTEAETEAETETEEITEAVTEAETEEVTEAETEEPTEAETEMEEVTEAVTEAETEEETEKVTEAVTEAETEEETEEGTEAESEEAEAEVMTYEEYIAADVDTLVVVETYVQAKQSWWDDTATVYTQDEDGAYFLYNMECSEEDYELLEVGTKIRVTGYKSEWSGEVEIIDATFEIVDDGDTFIAEALDVTDLLGTDELEEHQNEFVSFTDMTVEASEDPDGNEVAFLYAWDGSGEEGDDLYFNVSYNGETYTFVVESYLCDSTTEVYQAVTELEVGDVIDMEGFLYWYEGVNPHITFVGDFDAVEAESESETDAE